MASELRYSPLNWALVANEKNAAKTKYLELRSVFLAKFSYFNF